MTGRNQRAIAGRAYKYRMLLLLCVLLSFLLVTPIIETSGHGTVPMTTAFLAVILASINVSAERSFKGVLGVAIGLVAFVLLLARLGIDGHPIQIAADLAATFVLAFTTLVVLTSVLVSRASDFDTLCGAAAVYILLGITWALSFELIEGISPGSFEGLSDESVARWNQLVYFSLTTLTTMGYGDIIPRLPFVRIWATLEAVVGVLYLAILVARLVAIYRETVTSSHDR